MRALTRHVVYSLAGVSFLLAHGQSVAQDVSFNDHLKIKRLEQQDRSIRQSSRNPIVQRLQRQYANTADRTDEEILAYVLKMAHATPDYEKGFGTGSGNHHHHHHENPFLPERCKAEPGDEGYKRINFVTWDGKTFDATGTRPLIHGTVGKDLIIGTAYSDFIYGYGEADIICGLGGDDILFGDGSNWASEAGIDGVDVIFGGPGDDVLYGGGKVDYLTGGADHDTLLGGHAQDYLQGDSNGSLDSTPAIPAQWQGDDFMVGMEDYEWYFGQGGNDVINDTTYDSPSISTIPAIIDMEFQDGFIDTCYVTPEDAPVASAGGCEFTFW